MKLLMASVAGAAAVAALTASVFAASTPSIPITFQGMSRRYLLHVPASPSGVLVIALHGGTQTAEDQQTGTGFDALSDRERFIVAYPDGIEKSWADGRGTTNADRKHVDDVGFVRAVIADIPKTQPIDRRRVYVTGASNGAIMANRLGCEAADTFAAIAPVIGVLPANLLSTCHPTATISVVGIQSITDPIVPFAGGEVGIGMGISAGGKVAGSRATQELWRSANGCRATPETTTLPPRVDDGTSVVRRTFTGCRAGSEVTWYEIQGGGHRWPPRQSSAVMEMALRRVLGVSSQNIDASEVIWHFFAAHPRA